MRKMDTSWMLAVGMGIIVCMIGNHLMADGQILVPKVGSVGDTANGEDNAGSWDQSVADQIDQVPNSKIRVHTKAFSPPDGWAFKLFKYKLPEPAEVSYLVDIIPGGTWDYQVTVADGAGIKVTRIFDATVTNAGGFPLHLEGDLVPPPGQGAPQDFYWAARIAVAGMTAYRPRHGAGYAPFTRTAVSEEQEEDAAKGPGIRINNNDTDPDGEDDLIEVEIKRSSSNVELALHRGSGVIKVFRSADKQNEIGFTNDKTAALPFDGGNTLTVFVEWTDANHGTVDLHLEPPGNNNVMDTIKFHTFHSVVVALGGENQVPSDPPDANHGTFDVAVKLYRAGYDVHMYDEDKIDANGAGDTYNEVVMAIHDRHVAEVAIFGYSHGGGSTYDLSGRLDGNRNTIGAFTIVFTSYVDAVQNDNDIDTDQEHKFPPGSQHHINHYQQGSATDFWLDGGPTTPPPATNFELDVETTGWGANATHYMIDDFSEVKNKIENELNAKTTR